MDFPDHFDEKIESLIKQQEIKSLFINVEQLTQWNSALLTIILSLMELCEKYKIAFDVSLLPCEMTRLIQVAHRHPEKKIIQNLPVKHSFLYNVGNNTLLAIKDTTDVFKFLGSASLAFMQMIRGNI